MGFCYVQKTWLSAKNSVVAHAWFLFLFVLVILFYLKKKNLEEGSTEMPETWKSEWVLPAWCR